MVHCHVSPHISIAVPMFPYNANSFVAEYKVVNGVLQFDGGAGSMSSTAGIVLKDTLLGFVYIHNV